VTLTHRHHDTKRTRQRADAIYGIGDLPDGAGPELSVTTRWSRSFVG
jgi:hypothetical protein